MGVMQLLRMKSRWEEILALSGTEPVQRIMQKVPVLRVYRLRALFETGGLHQAMQYYLDLKKNLPPQVCQMLRYMGSDIFLFAFTGRICSLYKVLNKMRIADTPIGRYR
jgi:hypothetical protein